MPSAVEDCQGVYDGRRRNSRQEKEAATEMTEVGRPARSTDVHSMHRCWSGRPARSTEGL